MASPKIVAKIEAQEPSFRLAVLIDRPARELPIQPDFVGLRTQPDVGLVTVKLKEVDGIDAVEVA